MLQYVTNVTSIVTIAIVMVFLTGCGKYISNNDNCIPAVSFVSTDRYLFIAYRLVDESYANSFDPLRVSKTGDWLMEIKRNRDPQTIKDIAGDAVEMEIFPSNTRLFLSGKSKTKIPYGFLRSFQNEMTYLHGTISDKTVWIPALYLYELHNDGNKENFESLKKIGMETYKDIWSCPDN